LSIKTKHAKTWEKSDSQVNLNGAVNTWAERDTGSQAWWGDGASASTTAVLLPFLCSVFGWWPWGLVLPQFSLCLNESVSEKIVLIYFHQEQLLTWSSSFLAGMDTRACPSKSSNLWFVLY